MGVVAPINYAITIIALLDIAARIRARVGIGFNYGDYPLTAGSLFARLSVYEKVYHKGLQ